MRKEPAGTVDPGDAGSDGSEPGGDLGALIETERRLDRLLEESRARAAGVVEEARAEVAGAEAGLTVELEEALAALENDLLTERERAVQDVRRGLEAEAHRFREIGDDEVRRLAEGLLDPLVFSPGGAGEGPR